LSDDQRKVGASVPDTGMLELYKWEAKHYMGFSRRWRDIPKPSIAAVQGACIAGGLMLAWPCDIIIAADNARFSDPVVLMGIGGVEYHGHTWELGPRKAKEMLFTARAIDAVEAEKRGMVNQVVPVAELDSAAREMALRIAQMHPHALAMAKRAVNQTMDVMGQYAALQSCFDIHQLGHASAYAQTGQFVLVDHKAIKANT
jgi:enoyl-CoA hydratase